MSLIQEALRRKDDDDGEGKKPTPTPLTLATPLAAPQEAPPAAEPPPVAVPPPVVAPPVVSKPKSGMAKRVVGIILVLVLVIGGIAAGLLLSTGVLSPKAELDLTARPPPVPPPAAVQPSATASAQPQTPAPALPVKPEGAQTSAQPSTNPPAAAPAAPPVETTAAPAPESAPPAASPASLISAPIVVKASPPPRKERVVWPNLKLIGVMARGASGQGSAFISGNVVTAGDEIEGVRLIQVDQNGVILEYKGQTQYLRIGQSTL